MDNTQLFTIISAAVGNLGFPIVITAYLLMRFEKKIDSLNETFEKKIESLNETILALTQLIREEVRSKQ